MKTLNTAAVGSYEHSFWCISGATLITAASGASVASELSSGKRSMSLSRHNEHQSSLQASGASLSSGIRSKSLFRHEEQVSLQASELSSGIRSKSVFRHEHLMTEIQLLLTGKNLLPTSKEIGSSPHQVPYQH